MKWIYVIAVFTFLFAALTIKNDKYKLIHIFVIMLALIIYPFSVEYIVLSIFALIRKGLEYFPSNIYTSDLGAARPDPKKDKKLQPAEVPNVYLPAKIDLGELDKLDLK